MLALGESTKNTLGRNDMGRHGPLPRRDSSESKRGRNTYFRKGATPPAGTVEPPDDVKRDSAAFAFWQEHVPPLVAAKRLRPEHAAVFAVVCHVAAEVRSLAERVAAEGPVVSTGRSMKANPAVRLLRDARRDLFQFASAFGLTAVSDARLPQEPPEPSRGDTLLNRFIAGDRLTPDELAELGDG
jgi:P27 family predicted phage terminase small subunit